MSEKKEHLKLLLQFISKLLEQDGNEWFHDELALLFSKKMLSEKDTGIKLSAVTVKELGSIDKYLNEGIIPIIDYSKIMEERVKFQLQRDAIEMGKLRLSFYSKKISFEGFCKYAHFQSEEMINYYFHSISRGDLNVAKEIIKEFNPRFKDEMGTAKSPYNSISSIPHSIKQFSLIKKLNFDKRHGYTLSNIAKVRNLEIHRDSSRSTDENLQLFIRHEDFNMIYEALIYLRDKVVESIDQANLQLT